MELKIIILFVIFAYSHAQLASHLIFPLENYLKSIPPFTFPQPATVPVDGKTVTAVSPEKESFVKETKSRINKAFVTEPQDKMDKNMDKGKKESESPDDDTTVAATTVADDDESAAPPTTDAPVEKEVENPGDSDFQATLKSNRLQPGIEEIVPSSEKVLQIDRRIKTYTTEIVRTNSATFEKKTSVASASTSPSSPTGSSASTSTMSSKTPAKSTTVDVTNSETTAPTGGDAGQQLLARFKPKLAADFNSLSNSRQSPNGALNREFLKNIPHIKFTDPSNNGPPAESG